MNRTLKFAELGILIIVKLVLLRYLISYSMYDSVSESDFKYRVGIVSGVIGAAIHRVCNIALQIVVNDLYANIGDNFV